MKSLMLLTVLGLSAWLAASAPPASARTLDEILSAGELRVGVNPNYPPNALYNDKNELVGFEVDVAHKLADMLGVKAQFVVVDPASRVPFVTANKIDVVMGGMSRTPDRAKLIDFSVPLNTEGSAVLTTAGAPYKSIADMNTDAVTFAEVRGTTPVTFLQDKLPKAKLLFLDNWPDTLRAVATGRAVAVVADPSFYTSLLPNFPDTKWQILPGAAGPVVYDCLGLAKGNESLRSWLNVALFQIETAGFVDAAWRTWHHGDMVEPLKPNPYF
jgi:polar amino acid transport system substrate-binding protein